VSRGPAIAGRQPAIGELLTSTPAGVRHPAAAIGAPAGSSREPRAVVRGPRVCHFSRVYVIRAAARGARAAWHFLEWNQRVTGARAPKNGPVVRLRVLKLDFTHWMVFETLLYLWNNPSHENDMFKLLQAKRSPAPALLQVVPRSTHA